MIDLIPVVPARNTLERLANFTARLLAVPIAILSLGDDDLHTGAGTAQSGEWAMAVTSPDVHTVTSRLSDPRMLALPTVAAEFFPFHAAEPIVTADGWALGAVSIMDDQPRTLSASERDVLRDVADIAAEHVELQRAARRLASTEMALQEVSRRVVAVTGQSFFKSLVLELARVLDVDYVFVAELTDDGQRARVLALSVDGTLVDGVEYPLPGSPCQEVVSTGLCLHPHGVRAAFPDDQMLQDLQVESYLGVRLCCPEGGRIGWLAVMDRKEIENVYLAEAMLRLFADRAGAEIYRQQSEADLRRANEELARRVASSGALIAR
ncbi:MAG TPA: GAF domain-containing protein [Gemmatimonadales bacterium]|nr:GAF domain-containing protein [Gemmatimonadales bacterium]